VFAITKSSNPDPPQVKLSKPDPPQVKPSNSDPPQVKPMPRLPDVVPPTWEEVAPRFNRKYPGSDPGEMKHIYREGRDHALAQGDGRLFAERVERWLEGIPEVRLVMKSDRSGNLHGTVHNETGKTIEKLKLVIKTAVWERVYDVKVLVENNTTATFSVFIGDGLLEVESFKVVSGTVR